MSSSEDVKDFEKGRIRALQEERLHIQKKTFTKWMNSFLLKAKMEVQDLFTDLADGRMLLKLLEVISGEKLGKPNSGRMRVHRIENVNKSLAFLHTKVRLENIGAEDIVDGNPRMILGLIWTIILRFQIQEIEIDVDDDNETSVKKSAKDAPAPLVSAEDPRVQQRGNSRLLLFLAERLRLQCAHPPPPARPHQLQLPPT